MSFEEIAKELSDQLFSYLLRMSGDPVDADDLLQETLIKIAKGLPGFKQRSQAKTWAYKIATNTAIDFLRKRKKDKFLEFDEKHEITDFKELDSLVLDEMNECVRQVINSLPPDYRSALVLHSLQGKSLEETALICGVSLSTAKVRMYRAKKRLYNELNKKCDFYTSKEGNLRCDKKQ